MENLTDAPKRKRAARKSKFVPISTTSEDEIERMTEAQLHAEIRFLGLEPRPALRAYYDDHETYDEEFRLVKSVPMSAEERAEEDRKVHEVSMNSWRNQIYREKLEKILWDTSDKQLWSIVEEWESKQFPWREGRDFTPSAKRQTPREQLIRRAADAINVQADHQLNPRRKNAAKK